MLKNEKNTYTAIYIINSNCHRSSVRSDLFSLNREGDMLILEGEYYSAIEKYKAVLEINPDYHSFSQRTGRGLLLSLVNMMKHINR